ncbi:MAG: hypothetical protein O2960_16060, partial [Verrucomicrobia bacterium]|nr:hypothetical protein [Verrucomicrobiota bacterium]
SRHRLQRDVWPKRGVPGLVFWLAAKKRDSLSGKLPLDRPRHDAPPCLQHSPESDVYRSDGLLSAFERTESTLPMLRRKENLNRLKT